MERTESKLQDVSLLQDRYLHVRLTGEQFEYLNAYCRERNQSKSDLARELLSNILAMD